MEQRRVVVGDVFPAAGVVGDVDSKKVTKG
jgi:hypothetical protein